MTTKVTRLTRIALLFIAITAITLSSGCKPAVNTGKSVKSIAPEVASMADMDWQSMTQKEAIAALKKQLDGISEQLGILDKKFQTLNGSDKAIFNEKLMALRQEIWQARSTAVSGDIETGRKMITSLMSKIKDLM